MDYKVDKIQNYECKDWLLNKHYAKRMCSISYAFGLFDNDNILVGVITFGMPPSSTLSASICGKDYKDYVLELNRLVVNEGLPKNTLSFFVSNAIKMLPSNKIIVSFADANMNHNGYIYQATNFIYTGTSSNTSKLIDKFGQEFHFRNIGHYQKKLKGQMNLKRRIIDNLSDDLLKKEYRNVEGKNKYTGHCYVASETYYHLSDEELLVYHIKHEDSTHWFLRNDKNEIIDLTAPQFKTPVPYHKAKRGFFLTKEPSKRSSDLINRVLSSEFKIVKKRLNEEDLDRIEIAEYLRSFKGKWTSKKLDAEFGYKDTAAHWFRTDSGFSFPNVDDWKKLKTLLGFDDTHDDIMNAFEWTPCPADIMDKLELKKVNILPKHRYILFKGSKSFKQKCFKKLKLEIMDYPKGENKRYLNEYKPQVQGRLF
jgi:hypothetical protein